MNNVMRQWSRNHEKRNALMMRKTIVLPSRKILPGRANFRWQRVPLVAQISNLLYRRLGVGKPTESQSALESTEDRGLQIGDTAQRGAAATKVAQSCTLSVSVQFVADRADFSERGICSLRRRMSLRGWRFLEVCRIGEWKCNSFGVRPSSAAGTSAGSGAQDCPLTQVAFPHCCARGRVHSIRLRLRRAVTCYGVAIGLAMTALAQSSPPLYEIDFTKTEV